MGKGEFLSCFKGLQWTVVLGDGFIGGIFVGLASHWPDVGFRMLERVTAGIHRTVLGHAAIDAVVCRLLRPGAVWLRLDAWEAVPSASPCTPAPIGEIWRGSIGPAARPGRGRHGLSLGYSAHEGPCCRRPSGSRCRRRSAFLVH